MRTLAPTLALAALVLAGAPSSRAGEPPLAIRGVGIGEPVPAFEAVDADGAPFSLATARTIPEDEALAAATTAAKAYGGADATATTTLDSLPGVKVDGKPDPALRTAVVQAAWRRYGLVASAASTKDLATLGDVAKKIVASANAPIVLFAWSSGCPTIALYTDRLFEIFSSTGARVFPFACNAEETVESIRAAVAERKLPYRILLDKDAKLADVLGARTTPHTFVLDEKNVLRFSGAPDSDPALMGDEAKRIPYLKDALVSVADGRSVEIRMTNPKGCRIRRKKP